MRSIFNKLCPIEDDNKIIYNKNVIISHFFMGVGQIMYGQVIKGLIFLCAEIFAVIYMIAYGFEAIVGFFTLGTVTADAWAGTAGDNSVIMMLMGILTFIIITVIVALYISNIKDIKATKQLVDMGEKPLNFKQTLLNVFDKNFYKTALAIPIIGVCVFNVLPIIFMILIAFTNYGGSVVPPVLVDWVGFDSFIKVFSTGELGPTFSKILVWNIIWAILATAINYLGGLGLALLYNKKCVKAKAFWRAFPILAYAIPGFISLLAFKFMFSLSGPINDMILNLGGNYIDFLGLDGGIKTKIIGLAVNAWISIPMSMLLATGILSNMNTDLYEAAEIDGASAFRQFISLTLPFVLFATTPVLITQFIGNFNNFGIFYFLRGGLTMDGYFLASDTDLLINWLYNLSINNNYYAIGAAISLIIFIITSGISLIVYLSSPAYKQEDTFR